MVSRQDASAFQIPGRATDPANMSYSWQGVMQFLQHKETEIQSREVKLIEENKQLHEKVKRLEDELQKQASINHEIMKKMRVMELSMRQ